MRRQLRSLSFGCYWKDLSELTLITTLMPPNGLPQLFSFVNLRMFNFPFDRRDVIIAFEEMFHLSPHIH
jgi:hypothetical protein